MKSWIKDKNIVLGVCGGIAAYKSVELLRLMKKQGANVRVIMTQNATWFVGPMTFEALSDQPVCTNLFERDSEASMKHIAWAEQVDAVVIAPATANIIGKLANGIADDALSTFMLVVTSLKVVCPSMNTNMYQSRSVQRNLDILRADGYLVEEPDAGKLACGTVGPGRLPEPEDILDRLLHHLAPKDLSGKNIIVTAGPTREPIDPVRFIRNPSSGKMGFAVARAAEQRGGKVTLITGPTSLSDPLNITTVRIQTAREMANEVFDRLNDNHIVIKTAAVSDFRPTETARHKIKKENDDMVVYLQQNPDILKEAGRRKKNHILVGFAAETEELERNAGKKLTEKNLEIIVGNLVDHPKYGFQSDDNKVTFFYKDGTKEALPAMSKDEVAHTLLDRIAEKYLG